VAELRGWLIACSLAGWLARLLEGALSLPGLLVAGLTHRSQWLEWLGWVAGWLAGVAGSGPVWYFGLVSWLTAWLVALALHIARPPLCGTHVASYEVVVIVRAVTRSPPPT
jgi:hypothetical protein